MWRGITLGTLLLATTIISSSPVYANKKLLNSGTSTPTKKLLDSGNTSTSTGTTSTTSNTTTQITNTTTQLTNTTTQLTNTTTQITNTTTSPTTSNIEESIFQQINSYRRSKGLPALTRHSIIDEQARLHSQNMASGLVRFDHTGFDQRVATIKLTVRLSSAAENIAWNQGSSDPATMAVQGWLNSSGHLQNIVGDYNLTGIGVAKNSNGVYYLTQIFVKGY